MEGKVIDIESTIEKIKTKFIDLQNRVSKLYSFVLKIYENIKYDDRSDQNRINHVIKV